MRRSQTITPHLSLVLPVYNEFRRIKTGLKLAIDYLNRQKFSWEIIVVDDGSTDATVIKFCDTLTQTKPKPPVFLISTQKNFGKGHALRLGIASAAGKYIIFSDIDFSVPIKFIPTFLKALAHHHIAIGSRRLKQSQVVNPQHQLRQSLGQGFTQLANLILGLHHSDLTCGFKGFTNKVAHDLFSRQNINGWAFDSQVLFLAHKLEYTVTEIPVTWRNNPLTKVKLLPDTLASFLALFRIRLQAFSNLS